MPILTTDEAKIMSKDIGERGVVVGFQVQHPLLSNGWKSKWRPRAELLGLSINFLKESYRRSGEQRERDSSKYIRRHQPKYNGFVMN